MPYVGEIRIFGGNFAPVGWEFCSGQLLSIAENEILFTLIGTTYGGDGQSTFALPDLRGRVPVHMGNGYTLGQTGGSESQTLTLNQLPAHNHAYTYQPVASDAGGSQASPQNGYYAGSGRKGYYSALTDANAAMAAVGSSATTSPAGSPNTDPINKLQPYLAVYHIISLFGVFPSQT